LATGWTLHDLRHTAAHRMIKDPAVSLTDVQWVLGHAHLSTTAIYLRPDDHEVIGRIRDHHQQTDRQPPVVASGAYRAEVLETLLGNAGRAC
jgi:site-specific recombinase XerC